MRILSLDWDPSYQSDLSAEFEASGHEVHLFSRAADALASDREKRFDLIVTETQLPDRSGPQLLRDLKQARGGVLPKVIFLTDEEEPELRERCLAEGAVRYLLKSEGWPATVAEIHGVIKEIEPPSRVAATSSHGPRAESRVFRGNLETIEMPDIIQLLHLGKKSGILVLTGGPHEGRVYFTEGEVVAAESAGESGFQAFSAVLALKRGAFRFEAGPVQVKATIHQPTSSLMLDVLRLHDEEARRSYGGLQTESNGRGEDHEAEEAEFDFEHEAPEPARAGLRQAAATPTAGFSPTKDWSLKEPASPHEDGDFESDPREARGALSVDPLGTPLPRLPEAHVDGHEQDWATRPAATTDRPASTQARRRASRPAAPARRRFWSRVPRTALLVGGAAVAILTTGFVVLISGALRESGDAVEAVEKEDYRTLMREAANNQTKIDSLEQLIMELSNSVVGGFMTQEAAELRMASIQGEIRKASAERAAAQVALTDKKGAPAAQPAASTAAAEVRADPKPPAQTPAEAPTTPLATTVPASAKAASGGERDPARIAEAKRQADTADTAAPASASSDVWSAGPVLPPAPGSSFSTVGPESAAGVSDFSLASISEKPQFVPVESRPSPRTPPRPKYPKALAERKIGGTVTLWVLVSAAGRVEDVRVLRSAGYGELDKAAADAIRRTAYNPARRDGASVPAWVQQQVAFKLE